RAYGIGEFLEILGELSQESTKKGHLERKEKELIVLGIAFAKQCKRCIDIHTADAIKIGANNNEIEQVKKIALFMRATPHGNEELWKSWKSSWHEFSLGKGSIKAQQRELIALAISIIKQHKKNICFHIEKALDDGASKEEIFEVVPLTLLMDGAPALSQIPRIVKTLEELSD
ncbi:MAG: carboxymuconolactone decarboxylase family protein, partial [Gammaproteobacteria bacterium]|nr:carboxymuconolactone decarboxylase family protein [Gammaproteobacteria bacterium]